MNKWTDVYINFSFCWIRFILVLFLFETRARAEFYLCVYNKQQQQKQ